MPFDGATRQKLMPLTAQSKPSGGGTITWQLPRTGLLARIYVTVRGSVSGSLTNANALGMASIVRRVRVIANSGIDVFNVSGAGYHYLLRDFLEMEQDAVPSSTARNAVTATTFNLDMIIPIAINQRDPIGLFMLQSEQSVLTLSIDFETDSTVATGATVTATATPWVELFTVPLKQEDWPPLNMAHQILEDQQSIPAAGQFTYNWPRGNTYLQLLHGCGIGASGADNFSRYQLRMNQSDYLMDVTPTFLDLYRGYTGHESRIAGSIPIDFLGSSGLGTYDKLRDTINSAQLTDLASVITASDSGTLYTVRRQLVQLGG